jgi:hypothetical protein
MPVMAVMAVAGVRDAMAATARTARTFAGVTPALTAVGVAVAATVERQMTVEPTEMVVEGEAAVVVVTAATVWPVRQLIDATQGSAAAVVGADPAETPVKAAQPATVAELQVSVEPQEPEVTLGPVELGDRAQRTLPAEWATQEDPEAREVKVVPQEPAGLMATAEAAAAQDGVATVASVRQLAATVTAVTAELVGEGVTGAKPVSASVPPAWPATLAAAVSAATVAKGPQAPTVR